MNIVPFEPAWVDPVAALVTASFLETYGRSTEAALIARLRADGDVLCELVAFDEAELVGHVLFSKLALQREHAVLSGAALAPLCVARGRRGQGIARRLVEAGLSACRRAAVDGVVVLGDPALYARFGFSLELGARVRCPYSGPHLQALELVEGAFGTTTSATYAPAFRG